MIDKLFINQVPCKLSKIDQVPVAFKKHKIEGASLILASGQFGQLLIQRVKSPFYEVSYFVCKPKDAALIKLSAKKAFIGLHILLQNDCLFNFNGLGQMNFKEGQCNLFAFPSLEWNCQLTKGKEYAWLNITYPSDSIKPFIELFPKAGILAACINARTPFGLYELPVPVSFAGLDIIKCIQTCTYTNHLKVAYLKIKTAELLFIIMALPFSHLNQKQKQGRANIEKWYAIKNFISENYREHYKISSIAKKFSTNTTTLKNGFSEVFGYGLFTFLIKVRMSKAIDLLSNSQLPITQVAEQTGYSSSVSFVKAFKKYFGYTPGRMRNRQQENISV